MNGPQYETPAEIRMLQTLGADLVGMSTVHEAVAAHHMGAEVLAMSLVTNLAAGLGDALDHEDVLSVAATSAEAMGSLLARLVRRL
jgi:purine-nucleoside phosphorylase